MGGVETACSYFHAEQLTMAITLTPQEKEKFITFLKEQEIPNQPWHPRHGEQYKGLSEGLILHRTGWNTGKMDQILHLIAVLELGESEWSDIWEKGWGI